MREVMFIFHLLGLTMVVGSSFVYLFLGMASAKMDQEEARSFTLKTYSVSTMAHIGLTLSIISGLYLMTPYWPALSSLPLLISKLIFVLFLTITVILIGIAQNKARREKSESEIRRIRILSTISLLTGLTIVTFAVLVFG